MPAEIPCEQGNFRDLTGNVVPRKSRLTDGFTAVASIGAVPLRRQSVRVIPGCMFFVCSVKAPPSPVAHQLEILLMPDFVEKVEKSSVTKTRQIAIRWNIAAQHHRRPVEDLARCPIDKLAGPPADFLNAALVGLPEIEHRRKEVFQHNRAEPADC